MRGGTTYWQTGAREPVARIDIIGTSSREMEQDVCTGCSHTRSPASYEQSLVIRMRDCTFSWDHAQCDNHQSSRFGTNTRYTKDAS
jgi:hypothetical protein